MGSETGNRLRPPCLWEIGSGYFGCRTKDGGFDAHEFADKAKHDSVECGQLRADPPDDWAAADPDRFTR